MPFPDERDRNIIRRAEQVENLATDLCDWLSEYNPARRRTELLPVNESDEFEVLQLRRLAGSLYTSSKVPVAAAAYGASQVGKSLFMGQVLRPQSENYCPIGGDETLGEPAYLQEPLLRQRPEPAVRFAGSHGPGDPLHHQGPHRRRRLAAVSRDGPRLDPRRVAAGAGPRFPCRVQDARHDLAAGRAGNALRGPGAEVSRPAGRSQVADGHPRRLLLHAGGRSPRLPGHRGGDQRPVEPLPALRRRLRGGRGGAVLGQLALADRAVRQDRQFPQADHAGQPRPGHLLPLGRRPLPAGQPAVEGLRTAQFQDLEPRRLERHLPHAQGEVFRPRIPPQLGHGHRGTGNHPGRHAGTGHARAAAPPQRRVAEGDRADGLPRRAGHAGRADGHRARQADQRRHAGRADGNRQARQGLVPLRALRRRIADPDALPPAPRRQPGSQGPDEVSRREVGPGPLRREGLAAPRAGRDSRLVHRHVGPGRGVPQPRNLRREDPLRHAAEFDSRHAGQRDDRFRRQGQGVHQRLSHPLSRHVGHQRGAARGRQPGEMGPRPQGVPRIGTGEDLRPRPGRCAGTRP